MGRKGVSKQKPKTKSPVSSGGSQSSSGAVSSIARGAEPTLAHPAGKGEPASSSKGGKKR